MGGGLCLANSVNKLDPSVIKISAKMPVRKLLMNAGIETNELISLNENYGYNVSTGELQDLFKAGIVDAAKVPRCAIQNASSIACQILLTETLLIQDNPDLRNPM